MKLQTRLKRKLYDKLSQVIRGASTKTHVYDGHSHALLPDYFTSDYFHGHEFRECVIVREDDQDVLKCLWSGDRKYLGAGNKFNWRDIPYEC